MLPTKHRARACTYWAQRQAGKPHAYGKDANGKNWQQGKDYKDAANEIAELHKKAEGLRGSVRDVETRMKEVKDLAEQAKVLMAHLPSKQSAPASNAQLGQLWRAAGRPAQRTGRVTEEATRLASSQNEQPLAIQHDLYCLFDSSSTYFFTKMLQTYFQHLIYSVHTG